MAVNHAILEYFVQTAKSGVYSMKSGLANSTISGRVVLQASTDRLEGLEFTLPSFVENIAIVALLA